MVTLFPDLKFKVFLAKFKVFLEKRRVSQIKRFTGKADLNSQKESPNNFIFAQIFPTSRRSSALVQLDVIASALLYLFIIFASLNSAMIKYEQTLIQVV